MIDLTTLSMGDALLTRMGIEWIDAEAGKMVARIPVDGNTDQRGKLHGGAAVALAETLASAGTWIMQSDKAIMGVEIKANHLKSPQGGWVTGTGSLVYEDSGRAVWDIRITDEEGDLVALSTCTIAIRKPR